MDETLRDYGFVGAVLYFVLREGSALMHKMVNGKKSEAEFTVQLAIMQLAEAVKNQTAVLSRSIETQNQLLSEMRSEIVDQKAALARLEGKIR